MTNWVICLGEESSKPSKYYCVRMFWYSYSAWVFVAGNTCRGPTFQMIIFKQFILGHPSVALIRTRRYNISYYFLSRPTQHLGSLALPWRQTARKWKHARVRRPPRWRLMKLIYATCPDRSISWLACRKRCLLMEHLVWLYVQRCARYGWVMDQHL